MFRSKRTAVRIPETNRRKQKATLRRKREQAPHQQTPGANPAENGSSDGTDQPRPRRLTLPHTDGHELRDYRWENPAQGGPGTCTVHMKAQRPKTSRVPGGVLYKEGPKPKRTQRPKRARSRKGWPNSKKGRQRSQRPQPDQSTTQATLPRRKP